MSYTLLREFTRTAHKQHRCIWCGQPILIGERYIDERSTYEGEMQHHRWHPECDDATLVRRERFGDDLASVCWPLGEQWVSAEPREATPAEVEAIVSASLARWFRCASAPRSRI